MRRAVLLMACLLFGAAPVPAIAAEPEAPLGDYRQVEMIQAVLARVAESVAPSVVAIRSERQFGASRPDGSDEMPDDETHNRLRGRTWPAVGSGLIIDATGLILTNEHVIHDAVPEDITCVLSSGEVYTVKSVTSDPRSDLAVLRIDARDLPPVALGDAGLVRQGHFAIVLGNPFGIAWESQGKPSMSFGIISALGRPLTRQLDPLGERYYGNLIQTDARINPGNSGGPLLNIRGEVIGVTTAISTRSGSSEGVGYAIPIDRRTKSIISHLAIGERIEYGFLGVLLDNPSREDRRLAGGPSAGGALIREVERGTPAEKADLRPGDLVVEFDGVEVQDVDQLIREVGAAQVGVEVSMVFYRAGTRRTVHVAPARRDVLPGVNIEEPLAWRGMMLADPTAEIRSRFSLPADVQGVVVVEVSESGPADESGLEPGRVIRKLNGEPIVGVRQLRTLVPELHGPVKVQLNGRAAAELTLPEALSSRPGSS